MPGAVFDTIQRLSPPITLVQSDETTFTLAAFAPPAYAQTAVPFAKRPDVSWLTQMERSNYRFYTEGHQKGRTRHGFALLYSFKA